MWWSISGIVLVIIGISLAFGGTYLSLYNVINIDLKKAGTWKELYERGEQAKNSFVARVFDNSPYKLMASLVREGRFTERERKEIIDILNEIQ